MNFKKKISVIMAVHNSEQFLEESIKSILSQTFKEFEFIIIDDASTDLTLQIIKKYLKKDSRIKLLKNKRNIGLTKALNKGIKIANGKYIARQDGDDISYPKRLEIQYNFLEKNTDIILVGTNADFIDECGEILIKRKMPSSFKEIKSKCTKMNCFIHTSIMFKNNNIMYSGKFKYAQDRDLYFRLLSQGYKLMNINKYLVKSRFTPSSITSRKRNEQCFFSQKAIEFYEQRMEYGNDQYSDFNPEHEISSKKIINKNPNLIVCESILRFLLIENDIPKAKKIFWRYLKSNKNLNAKLLIYMFFLYFPFIYRYYRRIYYNKLN